MGIVTCCTCGLCNKQQPPNTEHKQQPEALPLHERQLVLNSDGESSDSSILISSSQSTSPLSSKNSGNNSPNITPHQNEITNTKLKEDDLVRVRIDGCTTWLESHIIDILDKDKYRVRVHYSREYDHYMQNKYIRIVNEDEIRINSKSVQTITNTSHIAKDIIDLYLNGRECHKYLKVLSNIIMQLNNSLNKQSYVEQRKYDIDYMQSRFLAIEILNYCFKPRYHWRLHCFWCLEFGIKMFRATCRSHVILSGATNQGHYGEHLSLMAFCDECNTEMHYEDYSFRCENKEHDICLKCVWNKIKQYHMLNSITQSDFISIDRYTKQCIVEYVVGGIIKFDTDF